MRPTRTEIRVWLAVPCIATIALGTGSHGQPEATPTSQSSAAIAPPDAVQRWSIREVEAPPDREHLAAKLRQFFVGARAIRVDTRVQQAGRQRFRAVAQMAPGAVRLDVFNPDGTRYGACSSIQGVQFEYRAEMKMPDGSVFQDCLLEWRAEPAPVIRPTLILSYDDLCLVGNVCESWLGPVDEGRAVVPEDWAKWLEDGVVLGEADVAGAACWVVQREYGAEGFHAQHVYFADKETGVLRRYATTQTTDTSIERVRDYEIIVYTEAPDVNWRLRDLAPREVTPNGEIEP